MNQRSSIFGRDALAVLLLALPVGLAACPGSLVSAAIPSEAPGATATPAAPSGGITRESAEPTVQPAGASGSPAPTQTPTTVVTGPFIIDMVIEPNRASIGTKAPAGATPFMVSAVQLSAKITLSNGLRKSVAIWKSQDSSVVEVDAEGLVTAGTKPGETIVVATTPDGLASASARITVVPDAGVGIFLE